MLSSIIVSRDIIKIYSITLHVMNAKHVFWVLRSATLIMQCLPLNYSLNTICHQILFYKLNVCGAIAGVNSLTDHYVVHYRFMRSYQCLSEHILDEHLSWSLSHILLLLIQTSFSSAKYILQQLGCQRNHYLHSLSLELSCSHVFRLGVFLLQIGWLGNNTPLTLYSGLYCPTLLYHAMQSRFI